MGYDEIHVNCDDDFVNNPVEMILAPANDGLGRWWRHNITLILLRLPLK